MSTAKVHWFEILKLTGKEIDILVADRDWVFGRGRDDPILAVAGIWPFWDFGRDYRGKMCQKCAILSARKFIVENPGQIRNWPRPDLEP